MDYQTLFNALKRHRQDPSEARIMPALRRVGDRLFVSTVRRGPGLAQGTLFGSTRPGLQAPGEWRAGREAEARPLTESPAGLQILPAGGGPALWETLRRLSGTRKGAAEIPWVCSLPGHMAFVKILELPSAPLDELRNMARLQVLPGLPFPEEDIVSDLALLQSDPSRGTSRVIFAASRLSLLERMLDFCTEAAQWPAGFVLNSVGLMSAIRALRRDAVPRYLHLDLDGAWATLDFVSEGRLENSRTFPLHEGAEGRDKLILECRSSWKSMQRLTWEKAYVSGGSASRRESFRAAMESEFKIAAESISYPSQSPGGELAPLALLGSPSVPNGERLDLAPEPIRNERLRERERREGVMTLAWVGLFLLALTLSVGGNLFYKAYTLASLKAQLRTLEPESRLASVASEHAKVLEDLSAKRSIPLTALSELHARAPAGISLRLFSYQQDGGLTVQGRCRELAQVVAYVNRLQASPAFSRIALRGSSVRGGRETDRVEFQLEGTLAVRPTEFSYE